METLLTLLLWVGIGFSIGLGLCLVIILAIKLYEKRFPKETPSPEEMAEKALAIAPESTIFISKHFLSLLGLSLQSKSGEKGFGEQLADFRAELWKRDIVVPCFQIRALPNGSDFNLLIKAENTEIFRGKVDVLNGEKGAIEGILAPIRKYFRTQEATKEIQKIENQGEKR